eukprot:CAMPEP_0185576398 /NCGR_PEP_ID=MMETSP0434-20130131/7333_1 /TAXON_ID=626734 ORGANISM="Favella taraikaensis, Strain Fe Narragansett Bay" /NCGR_SAMPLE_ID=MMETSP0434 /ASSEMBLY_ACC=CAM_ASM_000379 /LENGTH=133 /DNA_ID=CAMNT_0028193581 /DNA_START=891 /DNA_END=1288 /DNA_ORIENTATION=+
MAAPPMTMDSNQALMSEMVRNSHSVTLYETQVRKILQDLQARYNQQITIAVEDYPLDCNREGRQMRRSRVEELVILRQVQQSQHGDELKFLVDYVNELTYWFSSSDRQHGSRLQPNINDSFAVEQLAQMLTQR